MTIRHRTRRLVTHATSLTAPRKTGRQEDREERNVGIGQIPTGNRPGAIRCPGSNWSLTERISANAGSAGYIPPRAASASRTEPAAASTVTPPRSQASEARSAATNRPSRPHQLGPILEVQHPRPRGPRGHRRRIRNAQPRCPRRQAPGRAPTPRTTPGRASPRRRPPGRRPTTRGGLRPRPSRCRAWRGRAR